MNIKKGVLVISAMSLIFVGSIGHTRIIYTKKGLEIEKKINSKSVGIETVCQMLGDPCSNDYQKKH